MLTALAQTTSQTATSNTGTSNTATAPSQQHQLQLKQKQLKQHISSTIALRATATVSRASTCHIRDLMEVSLV